VSSVARNKARAKWGSPSHRDSLLGPRRTRAYQVAFALWSNRCHSPKAGALNASSQCRGVDKDPATKSRLRISLIRIRTCKNQSKTCAKPPVYAARCFWDPRKVQSYGKLWKAWLKMVVLRKSVATAELKTTRQTLFSPARSQNPSTLQHKHKTSAQFLPGKWIPSDCLKPPCHPL
jgi:hypothetical protein